MAVGLNMFLEPYTIASGGLTGLAIVFKSLFNTPLWLINLAFNIPLFIIGIKILGKKRCYKDSDRYFTTHFFLKSNRRLNNLQHNK